MDSQSLLRLPKAVLHDHLDGGLRPETVLELAAEISYDGLPADDVAGLEAWFHQQGAPSLEHYLAAFDHTIAVMQTPAALERVAYEAAIDLAADGVVYAEIRYAPRLHTERGLAPDAVMVAVDAGLRAGSAATGIEIGVIVDHLRQTPDADPVARLAVSRREAGVVAFDLSGPEAGFPPDAHRSACRIARRGGLGLTLHAGEGDGPHSIWRALDCGAQRIGHGVRIIEDCVVRDGEIVALGGLARAVRDQRVTLEVAISSNLDTGMYPTLAEHPVGALDRAGFAVTINTDNRLMSATGMSREFGLAAAHGFELEDLGRATEQALLAGFGAWPIRERLIREVVRPAYRMA
jgi:adenosine deaminase